MYMSNFRCLSPIEDNGTAMMLKFRPVLKVSNCIRAYRTAIICQKCCLDPGVVLVIFMLKMKYDKQGQYLIQSQK